MKDCAEWAEKSARFSGWYESQRKGEILGWANHYSPKYERCFVQVTMFYRGSKGDTSGPMMYTQLYDAFEGNDIAMENGDKTRTTFCNVRGVIGDCLAAAAFIKDRMQN